MIDRAPCDDASIARGPEDAPCAEAAKPWVLAATILGSSLAFIVGSVVNVALPAIQTQLAATAADMQWVINAYLLFLGALILAGGSLGDHYGRRRLFVLGTGLFAAASVGCGLAPDVRWLIALRAVQGVGAALLVPNSLAIISATFPADERGRAIGTWAGASALTTAFGPVLGGWLVDAFSWRWVFLVVLPFALAALAIALWRVPESRDIEAPGALDWTGTALVTGGLGALTYGLIASSEAGWTALPVLLALGAGAVLLTAFVVVEHRTEAPMVPPELFASSTFTGANVMTLLLYFALNGALFFLPFNLIQVQGFSATVAGAAFLPFTLVMGGLSRWSGGLLDRFGARRPLIVGPLIAALGLGLFALPGTDASYWGAFFFPMLILGVGMAVSVAPLTTVVMNAVPDGQAGTASGVNNAAARLAGLLAIAILGIVALGVFQAELADRLARADVPAAAQAAVLQASADLAATAVPRDASAATQAALRTTIDEAFVRAFRIVMLLAAALAALSAACAARLIKDAEARDT